MTGRQLTRRSEKVVGFGLELGSKQEGLGSWNQTDRCYSRPLCDETEQRFGDATDKLVSVRIKQFLRCKGSLNLQGCRSKLERLAKRFKRDPVRIGST